MNANDYISNIGFLLPVMGAAALLETAVPLFTRIRVPDGRRRANVAMTVQTLTTNFLLSAIVGIAVPALAAPEGSPGLLQIAAGLVAMDFAFGYFAHRSMHMVPALWRFHRVHHSDTFVDVTTTYRTHPVESVWRYACLLTAVWLFATPPAVVAIYRVVSAINGVFEHANVRVTPALDSLVTWLWVTPNMHKVHHSTNPAETDTNYGNLLSLYDRMLRTFTPSVRAFDIEYGLVETNGRERETFVDLLAMPWRQDSDTDAYIAGTTSRMKRSATVSEARAEMT